MTAATALSIIVLVAALAAAVCAALVAWRRVARDEHGLRLHEALVGQGIAQPQPDTMAAASRLAHAARRCITCARQDECDTLLVRRNWHKLRAICPNAAYMEALGATRP